MLRNLLFLTSFFLLLFSCKEISPVVTGSMGPAEPPINVDDQKRQVLIEEFTGVRCVNCPAGSAIIEDLLNSNAPNLIAVSIHAGEFSPPYPQSVFDFRTSEGTQILNYVGLPFGYPTAVINRRIFPNEFDRQLNSGQWPGFIAQERAEEPKVKIAIQPDFDENSGNVEVKTTLFIQETISEEAYLSLMITESGIVDLQLTPSSTTPKPDYSHKHVLRGMLTPYDGARITEPLLTGKEIELTFSGTISPEWKPEKCKIIAFVHLGGASLEVLQAHEVELLE
jgi:hypothetical protein